MASGSTGFPATNDVFTVPSDPENTPLSSAGDGTRDLTQSIGDQGAAIMGLEGLTALKTHNHAGGADGTHILPQSSTHAVPDTDTALTSIHHTLGRGANQAAPGNLQLDYAASRPDILNRPYLICDSLDRPPSPFPGLMIFETDTNFLRIWADTGSGYAWQLIPFLQVPTVQLQQARPQALHTPGWIELLWDDIVDDVGNLFNSAVDAAQIIVADAGLYATNLAVQFDPAIAPNVASVALFVNNSLSSIQSNVFQRGENYIPGFSQTVAAQGPIRLNSGDVVTGAVSYVASQGLGVVNTFVDQANSLTSRMGLTFLGI